MIPTSVRAVWNTPMQCAKRVWVALGKTKEGLISGFPMAQIRPLARRRGETAPTDTEFLPLPSSSAATG